MTPGSFENLKIIRFEGQLLPHWAQLLDLAARMSSVPAETSAWFSRFTHSSGVDDSRTIIEECNLLRARLAKSKRALSSELRRMRNDAQPSQILGAWEYALETMIQEAHSRKTCSWLIEGSEKPKVEEPVNITLRRI